MTANNSGATVSTDISRPSFQEGDVITPDIQRQLRSLNLDPGMVGETLTQDDVAALNRSTGTYDEAGLGVPETLPDLGEISGTRTLNDSEYQVLTRSVVIGNSSGPRTTQSYADNDPVWRQFYPEVEGRHNLLHDYNSYNYIITLVAISDDQAKNPSLYKGRIFTGTGVESSSYYVIAKSGGFARETGVVTGFKAGSSTDTSPNTRNKDLFIDDLEFDTRPGINDMGNSNITTGRFTITEPHGVGGFYKELFAGAKQAGHYNYLGAPFLLVISFIGRKVDNDQSEIPEKTTRYIPIMFKGSTMSVNESGAKYDVEFMGYNSGGATAHASALWDNIEPVVSAQETVEQIAMSVFRRNHLAHKEYLQKMQDTADSETRTEVTRRLNDTTFQQQALNSSGLGASTRVAAYIPDEYAVWFPPDWSGGNLKPNVSEWDYSGWEGSVDAMLANSANFTGPVYASIQNVFGMAGLNDSVAPTAGLAIQDHEEMITANRNAVKTEEDKISANNGTFQTEKATFEQARESLAKILEGKEGVREDILNTDLTTDINVTPSTAAEEATKTVDDAVNAAANVADNLTGGGAPPGIGPPAQGNLSQAEITQVLELRRVIVESGRRLKELTTANEEARDRIRILQDDRNTWPSMRYDLQSSGVPWHFKKGLNLASVLDILITNSQYMTILQDESLLNNIANSEFIPWYRIDVYAEVIGFDVVRMSPAKRFHYVVSPYNVHYSKLPGVNIIFSTKKLRGMAVREYNYIYTGKNLDVLNFDIKYNNLFTTPLLLRPPNAEALGASVQRQEVVNTAMPKTVHQETVNRIANAISNRLGESGFTPVQAASEKLTYRDLEITNRSHIGMALKDFLYNPPFEQALIRGDIEIVGDPVYIVGSGISDRPVLLTDDILTPDGEINGFSREPDIIFKFRNADDVPSAVDLQVGGIYQQPRIDGEFNGLFQVVKITNKFSEGVFTQTLSTLRRKNQEQDYEVTPVTEESAEESDNADANVGNVGASNEIEVRENTGVITSPVTGGEVPRTTELSSNSSTEQAATEAGVVTGTINTNINNSRGATDPILGDGTRGASLDQINNRLLYLDEEVERYEAIRDALPVGSAVREQYNTTIRSINAEREALDVQRDEIQGQGSF